MRILVAGGAGYVGSHVVRECRRVGHEVVVFDNYSTGHSESIDGVEQVSGDLRDDRTLRSVFENFRFDGVIQLASSHVSSTANERSAPFLQTVIGGTLNLARSMVDAGVERLVYGSSARADDPSSLLGRAHAQVEMHLEDIARSHPLSWLALRTHHVAGADLAGDIGEDHRPETHVLPRILRTALGLAPRFEIHGGRHDTADGTPARDFVHVTDVARAHVTAVERADEEGGRAVSIATGTPTTIGQLLAATRGVVGEIEFEAVEAEARPGVVSIEVGDPTAARELLGWEPQFSDVTTIVESAWEWHRRHPSGYAPGEQVGAVSEASPTRERGEKFGAVAIRMGLATERDVERALERQDREARDGGEHKLIGLHMLELGILSTSQLIEILRSYEE